MNVINEKIFTISSSALLGACLLSAPPAEASGLCTAADTGGKVVVQSGVTFPTTSLSNVAWAAER